MPDDRRDLYFLHHRVRVRNAPLGVRGRRELSHEHRNAGRLLLVARRAWEAAIRPFSTVRVKRYLYVFKGNDDANASMFHLGVANAKATRCRRCHVYFLYNYRDDKGVDDDHVTRHASLCVDCPDTFQCDYACTIRRDDRLFAGLKDNVVTRLIMRFVHVETSSHRVSSVLTR